MKRLPFEYRPPCGLTENPDNPTFHPRDQLDQLKDSIRSFGFAAPIIIDANGVVLCGNGRLIAARELGLNEVPTICVGHLNEAQRRALVLADNKIAEGSQWDEEQLAAELQKILDLEGEFEITDTGFQIGEIDHLLGQQFASDEDLPAEIPFDPGRVDEVNRPGDLWLIGPHRLFCGTALEMPSYDILLGKERASLTITDPPFNIRGAEISGLGKVKHGDFVQASGELTAAQFSRFLEEFLRCVQAVSDQGSLIYSFMDWRQIDRLLTVGRTIFGDPKALCVWNKGSGGMGTLYRSQHELIAVFKNGQAPHQNNVMLGTHGRNRTNVWSYPGLSSFGRGRTKALALHPTVKNLDMIADAIMDVTPIGSLVLDPFAGSGTTLIAAERTRRRAALIELDPKYCDVILRRACDATGLEPINAWTGEKIQRKPLTGKGKRCG